MLNVLHFHALTLVWDFCFLQKCSTTAPACEKLVIAAEFKQVPWGPQVFSEGKALENEQADILLEVSDA